MRTLEIPARDWTRALDDFSAMHDRWLVSVDLLSPTLGAQPQIHDLPLLGVTAESSARDSTITIAAGSPEAGHIEHVIHAPTRVRLERTNEGADVALEIESADGTAAILRFKTIVASELVDGVVHQ